MGTWESVHKVIVLERDLDAAGPLCLLLRGMGHVALAARDAEEALRLLHAESADCMLIDVDGPGEAGTALCRWVKRNELRHSVVAFALSDGAGAGRKASAEAGFDGWVVRPLRYEEARLLFGDARKR